MVSIIIFLILVFILFELYFYSLKKEKEGFTTNSRYDNYFNGDILLQDNETPVNIGVGTDPKSDYFIDVNGKLTIDGNLQVGNSILNYDIAKKINKLPLYSRDEYCLYDSTGKKQCIDENQLGMITGHNKVMFKNRYGEALSNLTLKYHGAHNRNDGGRPYSGWNMWKEGIMYRDFDTSWGFDFKNEHVKRGYPYKESHDTLENSPEGTPNNKNQFKLIAIEETDTRISEDDPDSKNVLIYNPARWNQRLFISYHDSFGLSRVRKNDVNNKIGQFLRPMTDAQKITAKANIETDGRFFNNKYIKLQKVKNENKYYIRVYDQPRDKWLYLESVDSNYHYNRPYTIRKLLVDVPTVKCKFTIGSYTETPFSFDNSFQIVYFLSETNRYLTLGTWNGTIWGARGIRFLPHMGGTDDSKFVLYIEPTLSSEDEEVFEPRKEYKCLN